jgi:hypothetical protein
MEHLNEVQISELCNNLDNQSPEQIDHVKTCVRCHTKYNEAIIIHQQLKNLEYHRPSMRFAKNIVELLVQKNKLDNASLLWTRIITGGILVAASLAVFMMIFWFISSFKGEASVQQNIYQWNIIFLTVVGTSWLLYFLDNWLRKNHRIQVGSPED